MRRQASKTSARLVTALVSVGLVACGPVSTTSPSPEGPSYPVTIHEANGSTVTINQQPRRIVSLSPTATELLYAIGAGPQVIAVDDQSNYPSGVPTTKLSGFTPNVEAIAGYTPDLVVASDDTAGLVHGLDVLSIPALIQPAARDVDDTYVQIQQLGAVTGHTQEAGALIGRMRSQIAAIVATVSKPTKQITVYHELDDTYFSATSKTFIGQAYALLGVRNIADGATAATSDYPQLSAEYIVASNPDLIVLADTKCCHQNVQTVGARPGWGSIAAVKSGEVVNVDDDIASRWGPRIVDFLKAVAPHVRELELQTA